jgi:hypothetical protein
MQLQLEECIHHPWFAHPDGPPPRADPHRAHTWQPSRMKKEKEKLLLGVTASSCILNQQLFQNRKRVHRSTRQDPLERPAGTVPGVHPKPVNGVMCPITSRVQMWTASTEHFKILECVNSCDLMKSRLSCSVWIT